MLGVGDERVHPITGERITVIAHSPDELVLEDVWPRDHVVATHRHPTMTERWVVQHGLIAITIDGAETIVPPGHEIEAPPGLSHSGRNVGDETAQVRISLQPAGRWLEFVARFFEGEDPRQLLLEFPADIAVV